MTVDPQRDRPSWTAFHARLHQTLRSRQLLPKGTRVLVAVSGGQDSLALLLLLHDLQPKWDWQLGVAHCDHGWRADAAANAAWVMDLARELGWPGMVRSRSADPQAAGDRPTEAAARTWRYRALADMAIAGNYPILVTAHTASDRAETLLHHLARGSGSDGLAALTWQRPLTVDRAITHPTIPHATIPHATIAHPTIAHPTIPHATIAHPTIPDAAIPDAAIPDAAISSSVTRDPTLQLVRPLLDFRRDETAEICAQWGRSPWEDSTNADLHYTRNRLRHTVIPTLQAAVNPQVEQALARAAEILGDEADCLAAIAQRCLAEAIGVGGGDRCLSRVDRTVLRHQPIAIQRRVLRLWIQEQLAIVLDFATTEKAVRLLNAPNRSQSDPLPGGSVLRVGDQWLELWAPAQS